MLELLMKERMKECKYKRKLVEFLFLNLGI